MTEHPTDRERRLRNLRAVARHLQTRDRGQAAKSSPGAEPGAAAGSDPAAGRGSEGTADADRSGAERRRRWMRWGPLGLAAAFLLGKLKLVVPLIKFAKLGTLITMLVSVWAYAQFWGWPFAAGFVLLIFVHELGHAVAMRQQGIPAGAPVFVPFVGAVIAMRGLPRDAWVEAYVGIAGPVLGSAAALVCLLIAAATGQEFWYALASTGFLINLFNLLPISPLDGGRIVGVISRWFWAVGYAIGIGIFLATGHPLLFLILLVGLMNLGRVIRGPREGYYEVAPSRRLTMGVAYFGLASLLTVGMWAADGRLESLRRSIG
jgi:Zn-dependent protease